MRSLAREPFIDFYGVGSHLQYKVQFVWMNQEDEKEVGDFLSSYKFPSLIWKVLSLPKNGDGDWFSLQETAMSNAWYEVLSVLHLMAMLLHSKANLLLLPRSSSDGHQQKVSDGK